MAHENVSPEDLRALRDLYPNLAGHSDDDIVRVLRRTALVGDLIKVAALTAVVFIALWAVTSRPLPSFLLALGLAIFDRAAWFLRGGAHRLDIDGLRRFEQRKARRNS